MKNNFSTKNILLSLLLLIVGFTACDKNDDLERNLNQLSVSYPKIEGEEVNAILLSVKTSKDVYASLSYESQAPVIDAFITSYVLKAVHLLNDESEISTDKFNIAKETGVVSVNESTMLKPGVYSLDIQLNTAKDAFVFEGAFKFQVNEISLSYNAGTVFLNEAFNSSIPVIKGDFIPVSYNLKNTIEGFSINATTGVISLSEGNNLSPETYYLDVEVNIKDLSIQFPKAFTIIVSKEIITPADLVYLSKEVTEGAHFELLPSVIGNDLVFSLEESTSDKITIDAITGMISASEGNSLAIGDYKINVKAVNSAGSVDAIFNLKVLKKKLPVPANLVYAVSELTIVKGSALKSVVPSIDNADGIVFSIKNHDFSIDTNTGVISLPEGNSLPLGDYVLTVFVTYKDGVIEFPYVFKIIIFNDIKAPTDLIYKSQKISEGDAFSVSPTFVGSNVVFTLDQASSDQIHINANTGVISVNEGNSLSVGSYTVKVIATNEGGSVKASLLITITQKIVVLAPSNLVYEATEIYTTSGSNFSSGTPSLDNAEGVEFSIDDDTHFVIDHKTGVIRFIAGVFAPGNDYNITVKASNTAGGFTSTNITVKVAEIVYSSKVFTGTIAEGLTAESPSFVNVGSGGKYDLRGVYFSGTIDGIEYTDVLLEGGSTAFGKEHVETITIALKLLRSSKFDTNKFRDWIGIPADAKGKKGKGVWDGSINIKPGVFIKGKYSLKIRYVESGTKYEFLHAVDIVLE